MEANKHMTCIAQQGDHHANKSIRGDYSALLDALAERTVYEPYKNIVRDYFGSFYNYKQLVLDKKILDKIKDRCKIN